MKQTLKPALKRIASLPLFRIVRYLYLRFYAYPRQFIWRNQWFQNTISAPATQGAVYLMASDYSNIGDVAIFLTSIDFLQKNLKQPLKCILTSKQSANRKALQTVISSGDTLFLQGGGNMGTLYPTEEMLRQNIVSWFPKNRIIILPQTVYFGTDFPLLAWRARRFYGKNTNLTVGVRDRYSLSTCRDLLKIHALLFPDMVLSVAPSRQKRYSRNKKVLLCLRRDSEKALSSIETAILEEELRSRGYELHFFDTDDMSGRDFKDRRAKVQETLDYFQNFQLVITDRFHGTIFSYVTRTPCIAFDNSYGKLSNGFLWFDGSNYMFFANSTKDAFRFLEAVESITTFQENRKLHDKFDELAALCSPSRREA